MTICPAPRIWFKGHASAWLFFFFAQLFLFLTPALYQIGEALKKKISSRVCMYARIVELYTFLFIFLLFLFYQKKGFGRNAL